MSTWILRPRVVRTAQRRAELTRARFPCRYAFPMSLVPVLDLLGLPAPVSPALPEGVLGVQVLGTRVAYETEKPP